MIGPDELKIKAERLFARYLAASVEQTPFFPLVIPCDKSVPERFDQLQQTLTALLAQAKNKRGWGYTVELKESQTRRHGKQSLPTRIVFETAGDFLRFIDKQAEFETFRAVATRLLARWPELKPWMLRYPNRVLEHASEWNSLIQILSYYRSHPRPGIYLREVPLPLSTKFIETHQGILDTLLSLLCPDALDETGQSFAERWGFRSKPRHFFRLRLLDPALAAKLAGLRTLTLDLDQLRQLPLPGGRVLIVENEMTFLTLPALPDTLAIWGQGNQALVLGRIEWLQDRALYYWGDIDTSGLRILANLRQGIPQLKALWMDRATLERHRQLLQSVQADLRALPEHLNAEELLLYLYLREHRLRLEQEHIPQALVLAELADLLAARS